MFLEIEGQGYDLLIELLESRIAELDPEIRRSQSSRFHDQLKQQQDTLQGMLRRLHESAWDVSA